MAPQGVLLGFVVVWGCWGVGVGFVVVFFYSPRLCRLRRPFPVRISPTRIGSAMRFCFFFCPPFTGRWSALLFGGIPRRFPPPLAPSSLSPERATSSWSADGCPTSSICVDPCPLRGPNSFCAPPLIVRCRCRFFADLLWQVPPVGSLRLARPPLCFCRASCDQIGLFFSAPHPCILPRVIPTQFLFSFFCRCPFWVPPREN